MSLDPARPTIPEPYPPAPSDSAAFPTQPVVPTGPIANIPRRKSPVSWLNLVLVLAAIVAVGGVAFAIGRSTAPVAVAGQRGTGNFGVGAFPRGSFDPGQLGGAGVGRLGGGGGLNLSGTVQSVTGDALSIVTANGQTVELSLGDATTYGTITPGAAADVKAGSKVEVKLDFGAGVGPTASAAASGPIGTASSVTVVP